MCRIVELKNPKAILYLIPLFEKHIFLQKPFFFLQKFKVKGMQLTIIFINDQSTNYFLS